MGKRAFENFGIAAERAENYTIAASRYLYQEEEEKNIISDIIKKLDIRPQDVCMDIGCGTGNVLIHLLPLVKSITGIDHPKCLEKLKERTTGIGNIYLIPGNFLDIDIKNRFDKIIVYSVLQCLEEEKEVFDFIEKALLLLNPGGKLLLGDIPNVSKQKRFFSTEKGKRYQRKWNKKRMQLRGKTKVESISDLLQDVEKDTKYVTLDDDLVLSVLDRVRKKGMDAYVLPHPDQLPFAGSREDILIEKGSD